LRLKSRKRLELRRRNRLKLRSKKGTKLLVELLSKFEKFCLRLIGCDLSITCFRGRLLLSLRLLVGDSILSSQIDDKTINL
jgi:hypothetical protein